MIEWKISQEAIDYQEAVDFMEERVEKIIAGKAKQLIWLTSHPKIYTAGISAKEEDLLNKNKIPVYKTNRGGQYTYHDTGMRIIYVMLDLKKIFSPFRPDISKFIVMLENWVIAILNEIGIKGEIRKKRVGIWVKGQDHKEKKIAAIGIKLKKWVSYHGIAINLDPNLENFAGIIPCGIKDFGVTSIAKEGKKTSLKELDKIIKKQFNF